MVKVDNATVQKVVEAIKDVRNPELQYEASATRDRWLAEIDAGLLQMSVEARDALEAA
jgi:hypothetical protein